MAQSVGRGLALLFLDRGTRRGEWSAARPGRTLPPGKTRYPFYRRLGGPQGWSGRAENLAPAGIGSPDRPARSESLYRLRYPSPPPSKCMSRYGVFRTATASFKILSSSSLINQPCRRYCSSVRYWQNLKINVKDVIVLSANYSTCVGEEISRCAVFISTFGQRGSWRNLDLRRNFICVLYTIGVTKPGTAPSFPETVSTLWFQRVQRFAAVILLSSRT